MLHPSHQAAVLLGQAAVGTSLHMVLLLISVGGLAVLQEPSLQPASWTLAGILGQLGQSGGGCCCN